MINSRFNKSIALFVYIFLNSKAFKIPPLFLMTEEALKNYGILSLKSGCPKKDITGTINTEK
jgi:hypothetical protein